MADSTNRRVQVGVDEAGRSTVVADAHDMAVAHDMGPDPEPAPDPREAEGPPSPS